MMFFLFLFSTISQTDDKQGRYIFFLKPGTYNIELYGAQGGAYENNAHNGGEGAYVNGTISIVGGRHFYAYVGGQGTNNKNPNGGGFNGGGNGDNNNFIGGGGSSDLRIDENDIEDRIIVAAGGSGTSSKLNGAPVGDVFGYCLYDDEKVSPSHAVGQNDGNIDGIGSTGPNVDLSYGSGGGGGFKGGIVTDS